MTTKETIDDFLAGKKMVIAGVSRDNKKFGKDVFDHLIKNEFTLIPINPNTKEIDGIKCYPNIKSIPEEIENLYVVTPKSQSKEIIEHAIEKGVKRIWIQQYSETPEIIKLVQEAGIELITKKCMFMYTEPQSIHKFHRSINKLFGQLYK